MRIFIAGDLCCKAPNSVEISDNLHSLIKSSDLSIINFEAVLDNNYLSSYCKSGPKIKQPAAIVEWLKYYGFNFIATANNHIMDYGLQCFDYTRELLTTFPYVIGSGSWDEAYKMQIVSVEDIKIGFLNLTELQFGVLSENKFNTHKGAAWINHFSVDNIVVEAKNQVDFLIIVAHAGLEMAEVPLPEWRDRYKQLINLGCDAVVAHHPHVVQGYETYKNKPIFYSLGNFCFSKLDNFDSPNWNIGACVVLDISSTNFSFSFLGITFDGQKISLIDDEIWNKKVLYLNSLLGSSYMEYVNKACLKALPDYWQLMHMSGLIHKDKYFIKSLLRWILRKYSEVHLINVLQCESHRWAFLRALSITNNL